MKNKLILILLMLPVVLASTPDYEIQDNIETTLDVGSQDMGDLIFTPKPYISDLYTKNNYDNETYQKFDRLIWEGQPVEIKRNNIVVVLTSGSQYYFDSVGEYKLTNLANASLNSTIIITSEDIPSYILNLNTPNGITGSLSQTNINLQQQRIVDLNLNVDKDLSPGDYDINIELDTDTPGLEDMTLEYEMSLPEIKTWIIEEDTVGDVAYGKTGKVENAGEIIIKNTGNTNFNIEVSAEGDAKTFVPTYGIQTIFKKSTLMIPLQLQIPSRQAKGNYSLTLLIEGGDNDTIEKDIIVVVQDNIPPKIESIEFLHGYAFLNNTITIYTDDNLGVSNATISYDDNTYIMVKDEQQFTHNTRFEKLSRYVFEICVYDNDGNTLCEEINKTFNKLDIIHANKNIKFPKVKYGKFARAPIFNLSISDLQDVKIRLKEFYADEINQSSIFDKCIIRIIDGDGSIKKFSKYEDKIIINEKGIILLEINCDTLTSYSGILEFVLPGYIEEIDDIRFNGDFAEYGLPTDFEQEWFGKTLDCDVIDMGDLESSYYKCELRLDISTKKNDLPIPTTISERERLDEELEEQAAIFNKKETRYRVIIGLLIGFLIVAILFTYFFNNIYPNLRFAISPREKDTKKSGNDAVWKKT